MKEFELNVAGLEPLHEEEVKSVYGGIGPFAIVLIAVAVGTFITEFKDVREGLSDGYAGRKPRH
ncbi:class IIb bacteriocin, lactobin A/cerein 7B family [Bacteroides pyogenes]|uniref:class IIb bacteriocin, lactobin A/cerein 7B family n=1 Tax=Bacteroides pyogenes TaxID=310300 RepID=UPI000E189115|nr:class IIb bacteriocin, lactobin A/cerein 7B family [Bacteroides pyogenes]MBB3894852.1 lactobin A/cerein 7B family class IIb bacteriocin [Bacteroides pyogenes]SUV33084.1 Uncharacterised protein [Bacteroides pyogenes]